MDIRLNVEDFPICLVVQDTEHRKGLFAGRANHLVGLSRYLLLARRPSFDSGVVESCLVRILGDPPLPTAFLPGSGDVCASSFTTHPRDTCLSPVVFIHLQIR